MKLYIFSINIRKTSVLVGMSGLKTVREIGERKIVKTIIKLLSKMPHMPIPMGDDISAVELEKNKMFCLKCDMLVSSTDVPPGMNLRQAGRKAVVSVVSDFASKGIRPIALLSSLGIPSNFREKEVREVISGLDKGAREYGTYVIGGDTNESSDLIIDCMGFGISNKNDFVGRYGAKPGNLVAVTGPFGETAAGLKIIKEGYPASDSIKHRLMKVIYEPRARLEEGLALAKTKALTSSIDSSDGLAISLYELSEKSKVGFKIEYLPVSDYAKKFADENNLDPLSLALYGGEEFELVFTFEPETMQKVQNALKGNLIVIGSVTSQKKILLKTNNGIEKILPAGWEHFSDKRPPIINLT